MKQTWFLMVMWLAMAGAAGSAPGPDVRAGGLVQQVPDTLERHQVYDINLHEPQELRQLLQRLNELAGTPHPAARRPRIALVLHGPEIEFFAIGNYAEYRDMVDLAARLDAFGVIEVKACQTRMESLGLGNDDLPGFIEIVPFGPAEVERLEQEEGYVRM
ncbi:DsrE family protein [Thiohalobacter thiocyanaticus]|uniref:Acyl-CoA transferase n=1 Tax=Thiohalobacter thiocyanaticus TaxID=585455 RepID=A0A426QIY4_9GAMM|nr:DsrE family protein [Thiohalobacter thiocyanaticus]RRQ21676.1 acyl-CoA transferase [Thiohalobacter thiocyanaticus]